MRVLDAPLSGAGPNACPVSAINVLNSQDLREAIKRHSGVKTLPQLFVNGKFAGGSDDIREVYESGRMAGFLTALGVAYAPEEGRPKLHLSKVSPAEVMHCYKAGRAAS